MKSALTSHSISFSHFLFPSFIYLILSPYPIAHLTSYLLISFYLFFNLILSTFVLRLFYCISYHLTLSHIISYHLLSFISGQQIRALSMILDHQMKTNPNFKIMVFFPTARQTGKRVRIFKITNRMLSMV